MENFENPNQPNEESTEDFLAKLADKAEKELPPSNEMLAARKEAVEEVRKMQEYIAELDNIATLEKVRESIKQDNRIKDNIKDVILEIINQRINEIGN